MTDSTLNSETFETLIEEIAAMSPEGRHALDETVGAIQDLENAGVAPALRRVIHRVFERSMVEFFSEETASSMQLPTRLVRFTLPDPEGIPLPRISDFPEISLSSVLDSRRSKRDYARRPMELEELSGVLQMAFLSNATEDGYGTRDVPQMPYPNIGGLDPVEVVVIINNVSGMERGYYRYDKVGHRLVLVSLGDYRQPLVEATFENDWIFYAPVIVVLSNDQRKVAWKYKTRGYRISFMDVGAALQNLYLSCTAHEMSCCAVAGYHDDKINRLMGYLPGGDRNVGCVVPIGPRPHSARIDRSTRR